MVDVYRFILALLVVQAHLLKDGAPWLAWQAVFAFYVLSGFLMTLVLNQQYGFGVVNFFRFLLNRLLRLYPAYWITILITALHILLIGSLDQLHGHLRLPATPAELVSTVALFGQVGFDSSWISTHRLSPSAWSLNVELICYIMLGVYFAKSARRLQVLLALGILVAGLEIITGVPDPAGEFHFQNRYTVLQAGLIPFALGGIAYFLRDRSFLKASWFRVIFLLALFALNFGAGYVSTFHRFVTGLYVAAILNFFFVAMLFEYDERQAKKKWQELLGGISYTIFISHWVIATLLFVYCGFPRGSLMLCFFSVIASVCFSILVRIYVEVPVERLRKKAFQTPALS